MILNFKNSQKFQSITLFDNSNTNRYEYKISYIQVFLIIAQFLQTHSITSLSENYGFIYLKILSKGLRPEKNFE